MKEADFTKMVTKKGSELFRPMPWRSDTHPYFILVSEIMLQQTQVERVTVKFSEFISQFPTVNTLASAPLSDVLSVWSGLGYNRRARYLHEAAKDIAQTRNGMLPTIANELIALPGVGKNTAGAIMTYAYNSYTPFIETNVRTVYFHHFFNKVTQVPDSEIIKLLDKTVDRAEPRNFYWALMDYGAFLKQQGFGHQTKSSHYKKQSPLQGSVREVRGQILRALIDKKMTRDELIQQVTYDTRFETALTSLLNDGLIKNTTDVYHLP